MWLSLAGKVLIAIATMVAIGACKTDAKSTGPQPITFDIPRIQYHSDLYLRPLSEETAMRNHRVFNELFQVSRVTGLSACILDLKKGIWSDVSGIEDTESNKMIKSTSQFHAGSIGKLATSTLILQLIEAKRFALDTKIDRWFAGSTHASRISIDHLLNHTAGLPANLANEQSETDGQVAAVRQALDMPLAFTPGKGFSYSNAGYVALGIILEKEYGHPLQDIIEQHFVAPLELEHTQAITKENRREILINSTHDGKPGQDSIDYSSPAGAGILSSAPCDLVKILHALLAGKLVEANTLDNMQKMAYPMSADGLLNWSRGLMVLDAPFGRIMFLNGRIKGFGAAVAYHPELNTFVAVMLNDDTQVGPFLMRFFTDFGEQSGS